MAVMEGYALGKFDHKNFNEVAFGKYIEQIPKVKEARMIKSGVFELDYKLNTLLSEQTGSHSAMIPIFARINGVVQNYNGSTTITGNTSKSYVQRVIALGRAAGFTEKDFSYDITGGTPFLEVVAQQINDFWDIALENDFIATLEGIFAESTSDTNKTKFIKEHTLDISTSAKDNTVTPTTLNNAVQKACGDKKNDFKVVIMHSQVATTLENLKVLDYYKYTDNTGIERDLTLATWNGREVVITDEGTVNGDKYTTYVLGKGAFKYAPLGVYIPDEVSRDPKTNGGETTLISRRRYVMAPKGISYIGKGISPMATELKTGTNWTIVGDGDANPTEVYPLKAIPIARIITKG